MAFVIGTLGAAGSVPANEALDFFRQERLHFAPPPPPPTWSPPERSEAPTRLTVTPRHADEGGLPGEHSYCVRTCDGFYFPVDQSGSSRPAEMCKALCPGSATELYTRPSGAATMDEAVSSRGSTYARLAAAYAYRSGLKPGCSCRSATTRTAFTMPIQDDPTLRSGDIVVTAKGVEVFQGRSKAPHPEKAFVEFRKAKGLSSALKAYLSMIDRPYRDAREASSDTSRHTRLLPAADRKRGPLDLPKVRLAVIGASAR